MDVGVVNLQKDLQDIEKVSEKLLLAKKKVLTTSIASVLICAYEMIIPAINIDFHVEYGRYSSTVRATSA